MVTKKQKLIWAWIIGKCGFYIADNTWNITGNYAYSLNDQGGIILTEFPDGLYRAEVFRFHKHDVYIFDESSTRDEGGEGFQKKFKDFKQYIDKYEFEKLLE